MEQSPASRILIYGIFFSLLVIMAFAFFALTGGTIKPGGTFGSTLTDVLYEPAAPEGGRRVPTGPRDLAPNERMREPELDREPSVPETPAEVQYFEAIQKARQQEERQAERLKPRDGILKFLETPLGRDVRAVSELARRGRTREAREYLPKVLKALEDQDPAVQTYMLKLAILVYKQEKDTSELDTALRQYLGRARTRLTSELSKLSKQEKDSMPESLRELDGLIVTLEKARGGASPR